jgi:cytosine/adenosine deaminase-related metal-dependent hydrolase
MRLGNLRLLGDEGRYDLVILDGRITAIQPSNPATAASPDSQSVNYGEFATIESNNTPTPPLPSSAVEARPAAYLDLDGALAFPGLINSHDHLDFNLFPRLGNRIYNNYTEWGPDIHTNNKNVIQPIVSIPQNLRTQWGMYKNLLNGFTTVVNHGEHLDIANPLINVFQDCYCLHSVGFEPNWKWKLNNPARKGQPVVLHVGEGTDNDATREIDELIRWNLLRRPLVGIHGVAMTEPQASAFHALVWCPDSNYFLLGRTAPVDRLKDKVPILFGTDSTLTSSWNAWTQIRQAREAGLLSDTQLLDTLTTAPAAAWGLKDHGVLAPGNPADIVIARPKPGLNSIDAFFSLNPDDILLVLHNGHIRLFDPSLLESITENELTVEDFQPVGPDGKYVGGDLPGLMQEIRQHCPGIVFQDTMG